VRWLRPGLLAAFIASGCAAWPTLSAPRELLANANAAVERGDYEHALHDYDDYLARYPDDWTAPYVLASRDAVAAVVAARAELAKARRDLAAREAELARLREELARARDDLARVKNDLERIKEIDLKREPPR